MRPFPRTATPTPRPAACRGLLGGGRRADRPPRRRRRPPQGPQKHVQRQIRSAHDDLDESSARCRRADRRASTAAQAELTERPARAGRRPGKLAAARRARPGDAGQARRRRGPARAGAAPTWPRASRPLDRAAAARGRHDHLDLRGGRPELLAFSVDLNAQTPADLTRQEELQNVIVGRETQAYDDLHAAEVLLQVRENEVRGRQGRRSPCSARRRPSTWSRWSELQRQRRRDGRDQGARRRSRAHARARPGRDRGRGQATRRSCAAARSGRRQRIRQRILRRRRGSARRRVPRRHRRPPDCTRSTARSPRRSATACTRSTTTGACTTATDFGAACGAAARTPPPAAR